MTMKEVIERICTSKIVFSSLFAYDPKKLSLRKKINIFYGVDLQSYYHVIFEIEKKSRFILKNVDEILTLVQMMEKIDAHAYRYKHLVLKAPLCSKAKSTLLQNGWKIYHDAM